MKIGYTRTIPGRDHQLDLKALEEFGCDVVYVDTGRDINKKWPQLEAAIESANPGDTLAISVLDALGTSAGGVLKLIQELSERSIYFASMQECVDTSTPAGSILPFLAGAIVASEKRLASERSQASMAALKHSGQPHGRPRTDDSMLQEAQKLIDSGLSVREAAERLGASQATLYRRLKLPFAKKNT